MDRVKRILYLSLMRAAKVQASLRIRAISPEPPLLAHTISEPRGTFRQKARSVPTLNGWAYAVEICHDGMLEDTNSLDGAPIMMELILRAADIITAETSGGLIQAYSRSPFVTAIGLEEKQRRRNVTRGSECCLAIIILKSKPHYDVDERKDLQA